MSIKDKKFILPNTSMKQVAYKMVFDDLMESSPLFRGRYDTKNGNESFINGIWTVMEYIACNVSKDVGDKFNNEFVENMTKSKNKEKRMSDNVLEIYS